MTISQSYMRSATVDGRPPCRRTAHLPKLGGCRPAANKGRHAGTPPSLTPCPGAADRLPCGHRRGEQRMATNRLIDRSIDTATRPSAGMRKAMAEAEVGDEQSAADPTTNALQDRVADLLGKETAVFLPSGTMCNQIALLVHCRPGDEVIAADMAHIFTSEAGGGSALAGVQTWPLATKRGIFGAAEFEAALRDPGGRHTPRSSLVCIEQTVNRGGGTVWPLDAIEDVACVAHRHGLAVHMDGARILNAAVASGIAAHRMAAPCDSVWLDLSKALGCPVGG